MVALRDPATGRVALVDSNGERGTHAARVQALSNGTIDVANTQALQVGVEIDDPEFGTITKYQHAGCATPILLETPQTVGSYVLASTARVEIGAACAADCSGV